MYRRNWRLLHYFWNNRPLLCRISKGSEKNKFLVPLQPILNYNESGFLLPYYAVSQIYIHQEFRASAFHTHFIAGLRVRVLDFLTGKQLAVDAPSIAGGSSQDPYLRLRSVLYFSDLSCHFDYFSQVFPVGALFISLV